MNHGHGTWCTKEDVLQDVEAATGQKQTDVDDRFLVIGEQPPPPHIISSDDDEIDLHFGTAAHTQKLDQTHHMGPDLNGITQMLRMVQEYENSEINERRTPEIVKQNSKIVISKLNPNVQEFIPRSTQTSSCDEATVDLLTNYASSHSNDVASLSNFVEKEVVAQNVNKVNNDTVEINTENITKEDRKQMEQKLKNKISAKPNSFEDLRQSNLAIVNLLKLYAKPEPKVTRPAAKPLKLLTPQYFQTQKASYNESNIKVSSNTSEGFSGHSASPSLPSTDLVENNEDDQLQNSVADKISDQSVAKSKSSFKINDLAINKNHNEIDSTPLNKENNNCNLLDEATSLTPDMANTSILCENGIIPSIVTEEPEDSIITESINKVNNWMDNKPYVTVSEKSKPVGPVLNFSTVACKRKDPGTCKSPIEVVDKKISKSSAKTYQPSSYVDELLKKYKERSKTPTTAMNIWDKLEEDLKKKDKEILNGKKKS